jgi:hypothetical protein
MKKHFLYLPILFFLSCCHLNDKEQVNDSLDTTYKHQIKHDTISRHQAIADSESNLARAEQAERDRSDSIQMANILNSALQFADQNKHRENFRHGFETVTEDSGVNVTVEITFNNIFERKRKHLLILRIAPAEVYVDIFLLENKETFKPLLSKRQSGMTYVDDSIRDVDGDRYEDFLIHWYPSSGCCLAEMYNVYLYQPQTGGFAKDFEFINPTFFPHKKLILGLEYGHIGETGLYKYKWNGAQVDTIEFIYPAFNQKSVLVKTIKPEYRPTTKDGVVLKRLPDEYKKMDSNSVNWFMDNFK